MPNRQAGGRRYPGGAGGGSSDEDNAGPGFQGGGFPRRPGGGGGDNPSSDDESFGSSVPRSMASRRSLRRREEMRMKTRMLEQALVEAFEACRTALEEPTTNISPFGNDVYKLRTAQAQVQNKGDQGIVMDILK